MATFDKVDYFEIEPVLAYEMRYMVSISQCSMA